jgi:D-alanine-D-alanine ligase
MTSMKKTVAVLFGGRSLEHEISVITAQQAMEAIDPEKYEVLPVYITQDGAWYLGDVLRKREFYKNLPSNFGQVQRVRFVPEPKEGGLFKVKKGILGTAYEQILVDVYMPIFHGQYGEDGCMQGLFEMSEVAYTGARLLSSAIAMNKNVCKKYLEAFGVPSLPSATVNKSDFRSSSESISAIEKSAGLGSYPLFVKPLHLGSSVGVSKANNKSELMAGLMKVFQYDAEAIVEPCVSKLMEINVSVIENGLGEDVSVVEIPVTDGAFLSYDDKYLRGGKGKGPKVAGSSGGMADLTRVINPQDLAPKYKEEVPKFARAAYRALSCTGVVRFDFNVDLESGNLYFNELNPLPGSMSFYLWDKTTPQLLLSDIVDRVIEGALTRLEEKKALNADFGFKALS